MTKTIENFKLKQANHERALLYYNIYKELESRFGRNEAVSILRSAIYNQGREFGKNLKKFAPNKFEELYKEFAFEPDGGVMFSPKKLRCNSETLEIKFMACPLKKAWEEIGLDNDELCTLLHCASALDEGTMNEAGFNLDIQIWKPGEKGCCMLKIRKK